MHAASSSASGSELPRAQVAILTSYTVDYHLGPQCAAVNRAYAERHGYAFLCREYPPWLDEDARHPTWNKVALLHEVLQGLLHPSDDAPPLVPQGTTHLLWVDADAVIIRQERPFDELWPAPHESLELVIGEDVTPACLVNAGVLGVRVSEWSAKLWADVWASNASRKFHKKRYHEQSALLTQLERRGEGIELFMHPFHSYRNNGPKRPKRFPHVAVLPRRAFNTNHCDIRATLPGTREPVAGGPVLDEDACDFIFHAAGHPILRLFGVPGTVEQWKPKKPIALKAVLAHAGLGPPLEVHELGGRMPAVGEAVAATWSALLAAKKPTAPPRRMRFPGRIMN